MHYIEGMACGLPVLYCVGGGGAKEICSTAGEEYGNLKEFMEKCQKFDPQNGSNMALLAQTVDRNQLGRFF